ncbi:hypothetical protein O7630_03080 [Micromonospora sp. WMMD718]|uniref:hypothetical protein n=1 Tax=Micromonospora sp. WMMD718 TaxID=3016098 RepID=UPI002416C9D2|nr:hypothetical protein [Micromonospora sp. WMMD718]MDG4749916.1 hypothetical protein [Micromonospora sp. WMMD718]
MASRQTTPDPRRRRRGDRSPEDGTPTPHGDPTPADTPPGQPNARGTLPLATHPPRTRATARITPQPDPPAPASQTPDAGHVEVQMLMRARLAAMAAPRDTDDSELAALRAVLRNAALMAHVRANVDQWPPLTEEQRDTIASLWPPPSR